MSKYAECVIKKWDKFCDKARNEFKISESKKWIFRGHKHGKSMQSSLERAAKYYGEELKVLGKAEKRLLREFKRRYHQYSSDAPKETDYLEWFSIMQHYGAPTRLLDFTYSPYVAAYFALEHTNEEAKGAESFEIIAIDARWAIKKCIELNGNSDKTRKFFEGPIDNSAIARKNFKDFFIEKSSKEFVCPFNPFRLSERISLQNGVFMCPGNVDETFETNLKNLDDWNDKTNIMKLILEFSTDEIRRSREHLYDLNITRATLFPGLGGFAESLKICPPKMLINESKSD